MVTNLSMDSRLEPKSFLPTIGVVRTEVYGKIGVAIELCCKTDFCARSSFFIKLSQEVLKTIIIHQPKPNGSVGVDGMDEVKKLLENASTVLQEALELKHCKLVGSTKKLACYNHHTNKISAIIEYEGGDEGTAKRLAMQIAATRPLSICGFDPSVRFWLPPSFTRKEGAGSSSSVPDESASGVSDAVGVEEALVNQVYIGSEDTKVSEVLSANNIRVTNFFWISLNN